jgi:predicted PurR-regulated permease PerM
VAIVFALFIGLLILIIAVVAPILLQQLSDVAAGIPDAYRWLALVAVPKLQAWLSLTPINLPEIDWQTSLSEHWSSVGKMTGGVVQQVTASSLSLLTGLLNVALVPVVAFYLMRDWDVMMAAIMKLVPRAMVQGVTTAINEAHSVLEAFVRGQLVVMSAQAVIYSTGLWLVGLNYAVALGLLAGAASIIPYAGAVIGIGSALTVAYLQFGLDLWALGPRRISIYFRSAHRELRADSYADRGSHWAPPCRRHFCSDGGWATRRVHWHIDRLTCGGCSTRVLSAIGWGLPHH